MRVLHIGIMSAMPEEVGSALEKISDIRMHEYGDLKIYSGFLNHESGNDCRLFISLVWSGWGKVSAARAATRLISFSETSIKKLDLILFTGVAGGIDKDVNQWDILIPEEIIQYDFNAAPLFPKYVIPALNKSKLIPSVKYSKIIYEKLILAKKNGKLNSFGEVKRGLIGTGDKFISDQSEIKKLRIQLPKLKAVEMEGGAVAQVAEQESVDFVVIRTISDKADDSASQDFSEFIKCYQKNSYKLISIAINSLIS